MSVGFDPSRRRFLGGGPVRLPPPWADAHRLAELCDGCGACACACPEAIVVVDRTPYVDFNRGECTFCGACAEACPQPIFAPVEERPWTTVAVVGSGCLADRGIVCQACRDACPADAIRFPMGTGGVPRPSLEPGLCTGCGACVSVCPSGAITVEAAPVGAAR
jgi:ferredoxin-type protein NapF